MIHHTLNFGEEEKRQLMEIALEGKQAEKMRRQFLNLFMILAVLCFFLGFLDGEVLLVLLSGVFLLLGLFGIRPYQKFLMRRAYKKLDERVISGERIYDIDKDGISITSAVGRGFTEWSSFAEHGERENYYWLRRIDQQMVLIDKRKLNASELDELKEYLKKL